MLGYKVSTEMLFLLVGLAGAALGYNWQWYRVPPFFYRVVDGALIVVSHDETFLRTIGIEREIVI